MEERVHGECFCMGAGPQVTAIAKTMAPAAALEHFHAARLEFLKGLRSLIDSRIEKMSRTEPHRGASVPVD